MKGLDIMEIVDAEKYRDVLEAELARHSLLPVQLIIVDDIADWAATRKVPCSRNPSAMAITDNAGAWVVLLRRSIDSDRLAGGMSRIFFSGFPDVRSVLSSPELFLRHTVLHELAHLANGWDQGREDDCDDWAFKKLERGGA